MSTHTIQTEIEVRFTFPGLADGDWETSRPTRNMLMSCPDCKAPYHSVNGIRLRCVPCIVARSWHGEQLSQLEFNADLDEHRHEMDRGGRVIDD